MASYWGLVVKRAWKDSAPIIDPSKLIGRLFIGGIAVAILFVLGSTIADARTQWWIIGLAAVGVFWLIVFLYNLVCAPGRLHRDQAKSIETLEQRIEKRKIQQTHIDEMRALWEEGEALFKSYSVRDFGQFSADARRWFERVRESLRATVKPNETWMFETIANLMPEKEAHNALAERLAKLRSVVNRMIELREDT